MNPNNQQPNPEQYFEELKKRIQEQEKQPGRVLTTEEERHMQDGFAVEEMTHSAGWAIIADELSMMPKAHVNPVGMTEQDWKFAELNAFWHGEVAKEILQLISGLISDAHELQRIKLGETPATQKMRF